MNKIEFFTAGESHGPCLTGIIINFPSGIKISLDKINNELSRRQRGYGRGGRMKIENDKIIITSGFNSKNITTGAPVSFYIENLDFENWKNKKEHDITTPRPGHADIYGAIKYNEKNIRNIIERSSARETAVRVACGSFFKQYFEKEKIEFYSFVTGIGEYDFYKNKCDITEKEKQFLFKSEFGVFDKKTENLIKKTVDSAIENKDSLGGRVRVIIKGVKTGLGSYVDFRERLEAKLGFAMLSIPSVKGINFGSMDYSYKTGRESHDRIISIGKNTVKHSSNNAGGITGGISTGENIWFDLFIKPVPTLMSPLETVEMFTGQKTLALKERADVWICPAAGVVAEAMAAYVIINEKNKI
jgi:chorismate synthase